MTVDIQKMLSLEGGSEGQELDEFILSVRNRYGLANISYVSSSLPGHSLTNPFYVTTFSEAWKERYRSEGYVAIDPVVNVGARSVLPLDWTMLPRARSPQGKSLSCGHWAQRAALAQMPNRVLGLRLSRTQLSHGSS
jgi:hypothetical protein